MTESEWLEIAKVVRGNWDKFCVEKEQFDTFHDALKEFDVRHVREAADRIIRGYAYPPIVATFTVYIEQVQKDEKYGNERAEKTKEKESTKKGTPDGKGWLRFIDWKFENKIPAPKDREEDARLKAKFEKEHPDWKPERRRDE